VTAVEERTTAEAAIVSAVLDYFEGWFDGDAERMERALHPGLAKRSLEKDGRTLNETSAEWMNDATARGVGRERDPGDRRIEVEVNDIHGTIANATVRSAVYREYVQLVQTTEGWKIVNTLWEWT
jgi:ribosomal protein S12 methylthiotransferase accessory factor YcaO